jgi:hypothetical protein
MSLRIRRGTEQERIGRTFDQGEIIWTTNGEKLYVGDGVTPGGKNIAAQLAGTNLAFNATTGTLGVTGLTTDLVTEGLNNKYFSAEAAQDAIGAAIAAGSQSGISVVYNDNGAGPASINFTVTGGGGGGLSDIVLDTSPSLGGNLDLNGKNIFGTGSIDVEGNFEVTGSITGDTLILTNGLGTELILNGNDISGTGDVRIGGNFTGTNISITGTISATNGLGANLNLNSRDITGFGGINIVGDIGAVNVIASTVDATGAITAASVGTDTLTLTGTSILGTETVGPSSPLGDISSPIYIGSNSNPNTLVLSSAGRYAVFTGLTDGPNSSSIMSRISRGSLATPTSVQPGDAIAFNQGQAFDGTNFVDIGGFGLFADINGTVSTGDVPGVFGVVFPVGEDLVSMSFNREGVLSAPVIQPGSFTTIQRDLLTPAVGMMIYNTTANKFQGYQNTGGTTLEWVDLS